MSEFKVEITAEQLTALSDKLLATWLTGDLPHDVRSAISKTVAEKMIQSDQWQKLADAITAKFESRRDEIAQRIVTGMVETMSRGIVEACRESVDQLSKRMENVRMY